VVFAHMILEQRIKAMLNPLKEFRGITVTFR
jgi:hypothetical protein